MNIDDFDLNSEDNREFNRIDLKVVIFEILMIGATVLCIITLNTQVRKAVEDDPDSSRSKRTEVCIINDIYKDNNSFYFEVSADDEATYHIEVTEDLFVTYKVGDLVEVTIKNNHPYLLNR